MLVLLTSCNKSLDMSNCCELLFNWSNTYLLAIPSLTKLWPSWILQRSCVSSSYNNWLNRVTISSWSCVFYIVLETWEVWNKKPMSLQYSGRNHITNFFSYLGVRICLHWWGRDHDSHWSLGYSFSSCIRNLRWFSRSHQSMRFSTIALQWAH